MRFYYYFFHEKDLEEILEEIKESVRPEFARHKYADLIASGDEIVVGKYKDAVFVATRSEVYFPPHLSMGEFEVEVVESFDKELESYTFRHGKYASKDKKLQLKMDFDEKFFYDILPSQLAELLKAEILLKDCMTWAESLSKEETVIIDEIVALSEKAKVTDIETLENLAFEISDLRTDFFRKFIRFKDFIEETFSCITSAEYISKTLDGFLSGRIEEIKRSMEILHYYESKFQQTLAGVSDAFQVVNLRLDMLRNKETLELQKRTSALQASAAIIEFVAVYYYTLKIWESFLPVKEVPSFISFLVLAVFTTVVVLHTDALGECIRERKLSKKLVALTAFLLLILTLMTLLPIVYG